MRGWHYIAEQSIDAVSTTNSLSRELSQPILRIFAATANHPLPLPCPSSSASGALVRSYHPQPVPVDFSLRFHFPISHRDLAQIRIYVAHENFPNVFLSFYENSSHSFIYIIAEEEFRFVLFKIELLYVYYCYQVLGCLPIPSFSVILSFRIISCNFLRRFYYIECANDV